jgi:D-apiose dehydrogenase
MADKKLRGALIGCGFFSKNHLHAWSQIDGAEIVALCDANEVRLQETATQFGISKTYLSAAEMFDKEELDFVDIATTVSSHKALVEMAAVNRVPCICQKPFASNLFDAVAMIKACEKYNVPLMIHENFRWQTPILAVKKALDQGAIGKPFWGRVSFRSAFDVFSGQPYLATEERFILQDLGIHIIDIARYLFGEVLTMSASTHRVNPKIKGEDVATMLMRHEDSITSIVDCSYSTVFENELFPQTLVEVDGEQGTLRLTADYKLTTYNKISGTKQIDCAPPLHSWAQRPWHNIQDSVLNIQTHWVECLRLGKAPATSGNDNLKTLLLVERAYESAENNQKMVNLPLEELLC